MSDDHERRGIVQHLTSLSVGETALDDLVELLAQSDVLREFQSLDPVGGAAVNAVVEADEVCAFNTYLQSVQHLKVSDRREYESTIEDEAVVNPSLVSLMEPGAPGSADRESQDTHSTSGCGYVAGDARFGQTSGHYTPAVSEVKPAPTAPVMQPAPDGASVDSPWDGYAAAEASSTHLMRRPEVPMAAAASASSVALGATTHDADDPGADAEDEAYDEIDAEIAASRRMARTPADIAEITAQIAEARAAVSPTFEQVLSHAAEDDTPPWLVSAESTLWSPSKEPSGMGPSSPSPSESPSTQRSGSHSLRAVSAKALMHRASKHGATEGVPEAEGLIRKALLGFRRRSLVVGVTAAIGVGLAMAPLALSPSLIPSMMKAYLRPIPPPSPSPEEIQGRIARIMATAASEIETAAQLAHLLPHEQRSGLGPDLEALFALTKGIEPPLRETQQVAHDACRHSLSRCPPLSCSPFPIQLYTPILLTLPPLHAARGAYL